MTMINQHQPSSSMFMITPYCLPFQEEESQKYRRGRYETSIVKWIRILLWFQCLGFVIHEMCGNDTVTRTTKHLVVVLTGDDTKASRTQQQQQYDYDHYYYYWTLLSIIVWSIFIIWLLFFWIIRRQQSYLWWILDYLSCQEETWTQRTPTKSSFRNILREIRKVIMANVAFILERISCDDIILSARQSLHSIVFRNHTNPTKINYNDGANDEEEKDQDDIVELSPLLDNKNDDDNMITSKSDLGTSTLSWMSQSKHTALTTTTTTTTMNAPTSNLMDRKYYTTDEEHLQYNQEDDDNTTEWFGTMNSYSSIQNKNV